MAEVELNQTEAGCEHSSALWAAEEGAPIDLVQQFNKLRRGKRTILIFTFAAGAAAVIFAFLLTPRYTSVTSFIPPASLGSGSLAASVLEGQLAATGGGALLSSSLKNSGDLYAGILKSRSIASELVKKFDLMHYYRVKKESLAEKDLASATDISVDPKSTIVTVEVTDKSPGLAQQLAQGYVDALRETNGRLALSQAAQRRLFFDEQLAREKDALEDAEVELKKTQEQSGMISPSGQTEAEIQTIAGTEAQIAVRQVQLAALRQSATEENPDVIRLKSEIEDLQGQLEQLQRGSGKEPSIAIPTEKVPEAQLEYVRKEREVKYHEALFDMLSRQDEAAKLDEAREAPVLQVLDAASYPDTKSSPKRLFYLLGGLAVGFLCGCIRVLAREPMAKLRAAIDSGR